MHDALLSLLNLKRPIFGMVIFRDRRIDNKSSDKALARPEFFFAALVTQRTRDAVFGQLVIFLVLVGPEGEVGENLSLASLQMRFITSHRHVTDGAFVLDRGLRFRMIKRLTPHACLPVGIA